MNELSVIVKELARGLKKRSRDWRYRLATGLLALFLLTALVVYRFSPKQERADCVFQISSSAQASVVQGDAFRVDKCVEVEKATTNSARTLGLSGRQSMPADKGMLFDFEEPDKYCMWMKDMHFALDMMWLNEDKEIIYMIEGVTPDTYPKSFCGPGEARYVVEVNAGIVKAGDLRIGQRLRF